MRSLCVLLVLLAAGCGQEKKTPIPFDQVPEPLLKIAREKLPDINFNRAMRKPNGDYEIIGKDNKGRVWEIDITPKGEVTEIEKPRLK